MIVASLALPGCSATGSGPSLPPPDDCGAAALQDKIGQPVTGTTATDAHVGGVPIQSRGNVRIVAPGQAITMDFNPERLTIDTDSAGNLVSARCT